LGRFRKLHVTDIVTVVLITHNRHESLKRAVASVVNQTYPHFELVVVSDCEKDVSPVLDEFKDERIVYIQSKRRLGMGIARNMGLRRARGKYVAYLGEDDVYYPDHLELLVAALATTSFNAAYCSSRRVLWQADAQGKRMTTQSGTIDRDYNKRRFLLVDYIPLTSVMHRRSLLESIGLFDQDLSLYEDWDFLIRLAQSNFLYHCDRVTSEVHVAREALNRRCYRQRLNVVKKIHGKYRVTANLGRNEKLSLAFGIQMMQLLGQHRTQGLLSFVHRVLMNYGFDLEYKLQILSEIGSVPEWSRGLKEEGPVARARTYDREVS
jgi:glycosyltransferase involved in cell wall biosynthesis